MNIVNDLGTAKLDQAINYLEFKLGYKYESESLNKEEIKLLLAETLSNYTVMDIIINFSELVYIKKNKNLDGE